MALQTFRAGAPLRGLAAYGESERDVFFGRDRDRDEVVKMVTGEGFRAGLVFGEPGVGKTSLIQAGVIPVLRQHGAVVVPCADLARPAQAFADALLHAGRGGIGPHQGEAPLAYAARVIANAPHNTLHLFLVDDVDVALAGNSDRVVSDLAELFTRVLSRGGGRARVLFVAAAEQVHVLGHLERRTGSLFPPSSRHELARLAASDAAGVLERVLSMGGVGVEPDLVEQVVTGIGHGGPVLPADLQIAALALRDLRITSGAALAKLGGTAELDGLWLAHAARASGQERTGLRILGELAQIGGPRTTDQIARRLGVGEAEVIRILGVLDDHGIVAAAGDRWEFRHPILAPRVREATAPARAAARRAYDLLGSKAQSGQRLTAGELRALRHEQIAPVTAAERDVVQRSKRFYLTILAGIAAVPVVLLAFLWFLNKGRYYYDLEPGSGGDRIVVRAGRSGLAGFHWLPAEPELGSIVADTGLSRAMVDDQAWKQIGSHDLGGDLDGWARGLDRLLRPQLGALLRYATTGDEAAIKTLSGLADDDEERAELLVALRPIARGTAAEVELVELATRSTSPALKTAAIAVAGAATGRGADVYREVLLAALTDDEPELRRIALTAVRGLGDERARELFTAALDRSQDTAVRRELTLEVSAGAADAPPSPDGAAGVLLDPKSNDHGAAQETLARAMITDRPAAIAASARVLASDAALPEDRKFAARLLLAHLGDSRGGDDLTPVIEAAHAAFGVARDGLREVVLPLYARVDPARAGADLVALSSQKPKKPTRIAIATAWGELARARTKDAVDALEKLVKDSDADVRTAAAAAYGYLGRSAQELLLKMVKNEGYQVMVGAAQGLANSAEVGANFDIAFTGIFKLWKEKGGLRRDAARILARLARRKPKNGDVIGYLSAAANVAEDGELRQIGVEGLCNAINAGNGDARNKLAKVTDDPSLEVRRKAIRCVADGKEPAKGAKIAAALITDKDDGIRLEAAKVLAAAARGKTSIDIAQALLRRLRDDSREVRLVVIHALPDLGDALAAERELASKKKSADKDVIASAFDAGDEVERLALLRAARKLGAGELVQVAISDASPQVRVAAIDLAIATGISASTTISRALADTDPNVRRAALERIGADVGEGRLDAAAVDRALALAVRDPDPSLSQLALTTLARGTDTEAVKRRLGRALASRTEAERAKAAAAAIGLVERDAGAAEELLTPLMNDPSHDVRVAMLPALGAAWATTNSADKLAQVLRGSERDAGRRLVATAAFLILARTEAGRAAATSALETVVKQGPALARRNAELALGLIAARADGITFLQQLVP